MTVTEDYDFHLAGSDLLSYSLTFSLFSDEAPCGEAHMTRN
jgi:hypothetical protein